MFQPLSKGSERRQHREWDVPSKTYGTQTSKATSPQPRTRKLRPNSPKPLDPSRVGRARRNSTRGIRRRQSTAEIPATHVDASSRWWDVVLRPRRDLVEGWLESWWKRQAILVIAPCIFVWMWVAIPFPTSEIGETVRSVNGSAWAGGISASNGTESDPPVRQLVDANFLFFLLWYYGVYLAAALLFITKLFDLYRLNWWPSSLGGMASYTFFWTVSLAFGFVAHHFDLFGIGARRNKRQPEDDDVDWQRKTFWIVLTFVTMLMPALICFSKLKRDRRHMYRHSMTDLQKAFLERQFMSRIPSSWFRFLWFMVVLGVASFALVAGQAFASLYLQTLPHTSLDAVFWVQTWVLTVTLLNQLCVWIIGAKIRSRALIFLYRYFFQAVLFTFYRNLFARLRSPQQFAFVQLLSSVAVLVLFPIQISKPWHKVLTVLVGYDKTYEEHVHAQAISFYVRGIAQNMTALSFLGWLCILHFGPNSSIYPFFQFSYAADPYTFRLTLLATLAIWASEILSSFLARKVMRWIAQVDVTQVGLDEMREYPELTAACGWASVHVSTNVLLFLARLNFK